MEKNEEAAKGNFFYQDIASVPVILATLMVLYFGVSFAVNGDIGNEGYANIFILPLSAALASVIGRISTSFSMPNFSNYRAFIVSIVIVIFALLIDLIANFDNNVFLLTFILVGVLSVFLSEAKRIEESDLILTIIIGFHLSVSYASSLIFDPGLDVDSQRTDIGIAFISFWLASISIGFTLMGLLRGTLNEMGKSSFFSEIPNFSKNRSFVIFSSIISIVYIIPLFQFNNYENLGVVWAVSTNVVILFYALCYFEKWHVLGSMVIVNWFIFTMAHLQEIGNTFYPGIFEEESFTGAFSWAFITFWLNVGAITLASKGYFGDIAPMRSKSKLRTWWDSNYYSILIPLSFIVALTVRVVWNVIPAMNAPGTGTWDMSGGSDPWYMKRIVDYILANNSHFIFDADRAYPMGAINPRPPLFTWSLALGGMALSWILESDNTGEIVWWSISSLPAIYGALVVFPVAGIAYKVHGRKAAIISAWLIALMPGHISRSTFGMVDHDSFAILLLSTAFYFWVNALSHMNQERIFTKTSTNPLYLLAGIRETWNRNPKVMSNATLAGIAFSVMALGWKGFVYGPGILFLVFSLQVLFNLFRSKDSLQLTAASLQMLFTAFIIPLPFYAWPGLNLVLDPSGLQPLFYIIGFTLILGWTTCSFRDKPWLLVLGVGTILVSFILSLLYVLQEANIYAGWDILFSGGFYFDKNKIFGTIGEAQAPSRGVLFASYGPIVALIGLGCAFVFLWRGARTNKMPFTLLGSWGIISTYMAWSAGRFIINATPVMAILGGIGIAMLWQSANFGNFSKEWRNSGIGTPRARFNSLWPATKKSVGVPVLVIVFMLVFTQHITYGIDSGIPRNSQSATDVDKAIYDITPDILRENLLGEFSILGGGDYNPNSANGLEYMGTFGPSFNSYGWNDAYAWLEEQDRDLGFSNRPAFLSWWDYGFSALAQGQHPTVADNFQSGIPHSGGMLLSQGQDDTIALFIATLAMGDKKYNNEVSQDLLDSLSSTMNADQIDEFQNIIENTQSSFVLERTMKLRASSDNIELLSGFSLDSNGNPSIIEEWVVVNEDGTRTSLGQNQSAALSLYNQSRGSSSVSSTMASWDEDMPPSHYYIGNYKYTNDLIKDFDSPSTPIHKTNSKLAMLRNFLVTAFDTDQLVDIYHGLSSITYSIQDYENSLGENTERNNEIRYFAVDNRLFPKGGAYYEDYSYHRSETTGIFHAPTGLSGLDMDDYIATFYQSQRGDGPIVPRTPQEYNDAYLSDLELQQSGALSDSTQVIRYVDIDYQHQEQFFETMVARTYVGYGSSTLGLEGDAETPSVWVNPQTTGKIGAPGSYLQNAWALPGAMMNHMVISNWYDNDYDDDGVLNSIDDSKCLDLIENNTASDISSGDNIIELEDASLLPFDGGAYLYHIEGNLSVKWTGKDGNTLTGVTGISKNVTSNSLLSHNPDPLCSSIYDSNHFVKILKYYSGATLEGTVSLDGEGIVPNARILIERDAFSGEEMPDENGNVIDEDPRTYWVPIGYTDANSEGEFSFTVPSGKIRVSAFIGETNLDAARAAIMSSDVGQTMFELTIEENNQRVINHVTGILGNVSGSTWLSETIVNISETQGHSNGVERVEVSIDVSSSSSSGVLSWTGNSEFNGAPILDAEVILSPSLDSIELDDYVVTTSNGSVEGEDLQFQGTGEVIFSGSGSVRSENILSVSDFTGTHIQSIYNNHSVSGDGLFTGVGKITNGIINDIIDINDCQNDSIPMGDDICKLADGEYLMDGTFNASGKYTSIGVSTFTRVLNQATLIGSGTFTTSEEPNLDSYGVINGTGVFSGSGLFSGPMVQPGTFTVNNAIPGLYDITIILEDGTSVDLDSTFNVPLLGSLAPILIDVPAGSISGSLVDTLGEVVNSPISLILNDNISSSIDATEDCSIVNFAPCLIYPDDQGKILFGPIAPGEYIAEIDSDMDGMPEVSELYLFDINSPTDVSFPSPLPDTSDIYFTVTDEGVNIADLNISFYQESMPDKEIAVNYDFESSNYFVELTQGTWILSHDIDENKQIWKSIDVDSEDMNLEINIEISKLISGVVKNTIQTDSITGNPIESVLPNTLVSFFWDDLSTSTYTNLEGQFDITLPVNSTVDVSVEYSLEKAYSSNARFIVNDVLSDVQNISLLVEESVIVDGTVSMDVIGNYYTDSLKDWTEISVIATQSPENSSLPDTRASVDSSGNFQMYLKEGDWKFTLADSPILSDEQTITINSTNKIVDLLTQSNHSTLIIDFYLDHSGDSNISNGTLVSYPFAIKSLNPLIPTKEISLEDPEWISEGRAEVNLIPGSYSIVVDRPNPNSGNLFDTLYTTDDNIRVGLIAEDINTSIAFEPKWLTNITFNNESGGPLSDHLVRFKDMESGWLLSFMTNSSGSISEYIPEGEWMIIIENFESSPGIYESLRQASSISSTSAGLDSIMSTAEVAMVNIILSDDGAPLPDVQVNLESTERGSLKSLYSNGLGIIELKIEPDYWNLELNYTDSEGVMWIVESMPISESGLVAGNNTDVIVNVTKLVILKGTVFWDLNDNQQPNSGEGVSNVTVSLESGIENQYLTTDEDGTWSTYLLYGGTWNISTYIDGFSNETASVSLISDSNSEHIQITAGSVSVSGSVSYIDETQFNQIKDDLTIILIPSEGIVRDRVTPNMMMDENNSWNGEWDAMLEPGDWLVWAFVSSSNDVPYLVSIDNLNVGVDGGSIDSELSLGGKLVMDTEWLDYEGVPHSLTDIESHNIVINLQSSGISWDESLDSEGLLELILPVGRIDTSSSFNITQEDRNMDYYGGQGATIRPSQETPVTTLLIDRLSKQDISIINSNDDNIMLSLNNTNCNLDCNYDSVVFKLDIEYLGHQAFDSYSISSVVPGADGQDWSVEFKDSNNSWVSTTSIELGLENSLILNDFSVRIIPPNASTAHHLFNGHQIKIIFVTDQGYSIEHPLLVNVPQNNLFSSIGYPEEIIGVAPGEPSVIDFNFINDGNGDDVFTFDFSVDSLENWNIAGISSQPIAPFTEGQTSVTITPPSNMSDNPYTLSLIVTDSEDNSYGPFDVLVQKSSPILSLSSSTRIQLLSGDSGPISGEIATYLVKVENDGLIDADSVELNIILCQDIYCVEKINVNGSDIRNVPANGEATFYIEMDFRNIDVGKYFVQIYFTDIPRIDSSDLMSCVDLSPGQTECTMEAQTLAPGTDTEQPILGYIIGIFLISIILYIISRSTRRPGAPF